MTMTTALPQLDVVTSWVPDELTLVSTTDRELPSWLAQRMTAFVPTYCGICHEVEQPHESVYYESGRGHAAHVGCWLVQLTARPVRVLGVRYH
jgi:hypothetical protein